MQITVSQASDLVHYHKGQIPKYHMDEAKRTHFFAVLNLWIQLWDLTPVTSQRIEAGIVDAAE